MEKDEKKITTTVEDVQKAVDKKADEKSEAKAINVIEEFSKVATDLVATLKEVGEAVKSRPEPKEIDVPDLIKQISSPVIQVRDLKHRVGITAIAMAQSVMNKGAKPSETPFSDALKSMGIDENSLLSSEGIKNMNASILADGGVFIPEIWNNEIIPRRLGALPHP